MNSDITTDDLGYNSKLEEYRIEEKTGSNDKTGEVKL